MSSLEHHGIKGQKWGVRRFQNPDGTRTSEGKKRESKYVFKDTDYRVLDGKRVLSRVQVEDVSLEHPFYATYTDHDIKKYAGLYGYSLLRRSRSEAVKKLKAAIKSGNVSDIDAAKGRLDASEKMIIYQNKLAINSDIRIPSKKRASEITADLLRRKSFKQNVEKSIEYSKDRLVRPQQQIVFNKALRILKKKDTSELSDRDAAMVYTAFNISLTFHDKNSIAAQNKFYSELKKYGYGAVSDINDKKYSSFHAEDPLIIFDLDKIQPNKLAPLEKKEMAAYYRRYNAERIVKEISTFGINTMREVVGRDYLYHLGGSMNYIYGNTLVLGDSSYLEHHGIKGQRWGVRRFQNKDGSLTNAGRKRLGYSTKDVKSAVIKGGKAVGGAVATVGKAGYNLGKKAAAAGKAHSEKKKAEKLEKKKEKAAKTRLGVVKNADLFTAAEMAELNKRFKAKDEMTLASLQKGADYFRLAAGMVGSVASINKDFESMTGKSLIPNPVKKEKEKREADERAEDRARKLAKEDAEEDRKRRADERKSRADDIDFKNKSEDLKNKKSEELRKQAAEARAQAKQTWDEAQAAEKTRAMKGVADENEAKAAIKRQELKTNEIAQREEAVAKREAATKSQEEQNEANRKLILNYARDLDTLRDTLNKATDELKNADNVTEQRRKEIWEAIKKAQDDALKHDDMNELYLEHHGIKGQRWGVRRFRNPDGTLTDKGRKHYQKKLDIEKRKLTNADSYRGYYERRRTPGAVLFGVVGAISGGLMGAAVGPAGVAAGAAIVGSISAGTKYGVDTASGIVAGLGANRSKKKIAKYKEMLKQDAFIIEDGTLYLEHFGIKNMKWGVRRFQNKDGSLTEAGKKRYGSGNDGEELSGGGGGGGAPEEDEEMKKKIEEAAKKAGMTVAEYRKKYANVIANMKQAAKERKEGRQAELAKEAIYGKKEDHLPVLDNKLKLQGPKDAKEAMERYARSAETSRKAADAAYEYEKNNTNSRKDLDKWRNARYLGDSKFHQSIDAEETARRAQAVYNNSKQAKIDEAKRKGAKAISDLKRNTKQTAKNVGSKLYDAAGGYHKKEAEEYAKAADDTLRYAQSVDRKGDADLAKAASARRKGNTGAHSSYATYGGNAKLVAKKRYEEASALRAGASKSKEKYEKSLAGRYDKLKATMAERGKAKKKDSGAGTHVLPKVKSGTATAKPMRKLTSKELSKIRSEARVKQLKKDGDYTGEYKKKRRK